MDPLQSYTMLQCLPLEMLDLILLKTTMKLVLPQWESTGYHIQPSMFSHLLTVWSEWSNRMNTRWFKIVLLRELKRFNPLEKYLDEPQLVATIHVEESVWGIAQLENKIFVISISSSELLVYNAQTYEPIKGYKVNDLSDPRDLASDSIKKCLYIVETGRNQLRSIDADGRFLMSRILSSEAHNISVTETGTVVLLFEDGVKEFNSAGLLLREITFSDTSNGNLKITDFGANHDKTVTKVRQCSCMKMTWQALSLGSDGYIACQGWASSENHRVYIADRKWQITQSYGHRGHSAGQLYDPVYLSRDRDGCVLVADSGNSKVVLLTKNKLVYIRDLLSEKDEVYLPYRLLLDNAKGLLYVGLGVHFGAKVLVYQIFKSVGR